MTFKPGESGNPNGRPPGAENRLTRKAKYYAERFLDEIKAQGVSEIAKSGKMSDYVNIIKAILPKNFELSGTDGNPIDTKLTIEFVKPDDSTVSGKA